MTITYRPKGVCSRLMQVEVEDGIIRKVEVKGGCSGNLQGISRLLVGMPVQQTIERLEGVRCGLKPTSCPDQLAQALKQALAEKPKLVLVESPSNPLLRVVDIAKICQLARDAGAISVVDNTFLSPALQNPLALGADLVLHSCTKYLNGHSDVVAGVVIAKDPDVVTELAWWANNIGVTAGAFDSYLLLRGIRTLSPRMDVAQRNAQAIVDFLKTQPLVKKLYHPSLPENQGHEIAARQQKGFGAMLSFELDGDEQTLRRFLSGLSLFTLAESLGGVESLISHAATMTHAGMAPEARAAAGISETLLRISTGIEDSEDLIADLENGFRIAAKG